jgi:hypothetical protein
MTRRPTPALRRTLGRAVAPCYRHQCFRWVWGAVQGGTDDAPLPAGFEFVEAGEADLPLLRQLDADFPRAPEFLAAGHRLWIIHNGDELAFSVWTFIDRAPTAASRTGWIALPPGVVNVEDTNAHPDRRGRGLAAAAWGRLVGQLAREGSATHMVSAFLDTNHVSRAVAARSGWREFAVTDVTKVGLLRDDAAWRMRSADRALASTRLRIERPDPQTAGTPEDEQFFAWLQTAVRAGVSGPA